MIAKTCIAMGAAFFVLLVLSPSVLAADMTLVPVASYVNRPEVVEKEGQRVAKILGDGKVIHWSGDRCFDKDYWRKWTIDHKSGSDVVIFAPRSRSSEARLLLARTIKAEGLRITLLGDDALNVTLESILEPAKKP